MCKTSARWYSLLLGAACVFGIPSVALAQTSLTWAKVEQLHNRVHLIPSNRNARLARITDVMNVGDALRTASLSRAELRFNDGSLARVGEQATFRFTPDTRNFQLSNGTVLLLIPPGQGRTTIQTPNAVTGIQGSALFIRVRCLAELTAEGYCASPITLVGALTNNPAGAMVAYTESGSQQQSIYAGEIVVIEGDTITQRHEFDLRAFYQTSGLAAGLELDSSTPPTSLSEDLHGVWQEIQDALKLQGDFDYQGAEEDIVENPEFIAPVVSAVPSDESELDDSLFSGFPAFASSPASIFHSIDKPVATAQPAGTYPEIIGNDTADDGSITAVTSARIRESFNTGTETPQAAGPLPVAEPTPPAPIAEPVTASPPSPAAAAPVPTVTAPPVEPPDSPVVPSNEEIPAVPEKPELPPELTPVAPNPVAETPPVVNEPAVPAPQPPVAAPPPVTQAEPPNTPPEQPELPPLEADQVPDRSPIPEGGLDWNQQ